ncbi:MFS transporter [Streptomyces sp. ACA25]|uniref:MFS transporter n=1 Tax=Streptomyces sp. ACA25 TaxID=3022596 RepID=UPI00230758CF|nr:MFS transporter [Streptomyces sp. ACA25]MDB1087482.1 MFS transporter [Streptomyces sp. ACA25]
MTHEVTAHVPARPAVPDEQRPPIGRAWTLRFACASTGMWLAVLTPIQVQLARQAELFAPASKEAVLGLATGLGAAVTVAMVPLFGALSDRTRSRFGRRRPWVAFGSVLAALGLLLLATADGVGGMLLGWLVAQIGLSSVQAGLYATIPDQVPRPQLGTLAGWAGMTQMLGALLGTLVVNQLVPGLAGGYVACAVLVLCAVLPFLLGHREADSRTGPAVRLPAADRRPRVPRSPDLLWTWVSRFLVVLGFAMISQYLLFYLTDELLVADPQRAVMTITGVTVLCAMTAAMTAGRWSDRVGRRRVFVVGGGVLMGVGAVAMALFPVWPVALFAAVVVGLGFGTFLAVDLAVIASVLPSAEDAGRDLGFFAIAAAAPQIVAPALAVPVLAVAGYGGLYLLTAAVSAVGGALVLKVRSVV